MNRWEKRAVRYNSLTPESRAWVDEFSAWADSTWDPAMRMLCVLVFLLNQEAWWAGLIVALLGFVLVFGGLLWGSFRWIAENQPPPTWPSRDA